MKYLYARPAQQTALAVVLLLFSVTLGCAAQLKMAAGITEVGHSIQVGAFKEVKNAERLTAKLQEKGIEAFYFKKDNGVYAVRFGDYPSKEKARQVAQKLATDKIIGAYFIAPPAVGPVTTDVRRSAVAANAKEKERKPKPESEADPTRKHTVQPDMGNIAARTAERFVGIPYRWGGNTVVDGMDCSGFARAVYNLCGVNIPRTSGEQYRVGQDIGKGELRDGDLVFFGESGRINHVGIYVGNGKFVHAPRRGDDIKISLLSDNYFEKKFMGGRRYF